MLRNFIRYRENYLLMMGHFATDVCQGSLSAALAVLYANGRLENNVQVSLLILAACFVSSIIQPLFGYISDLKPRPYLMATGFVTAALGLMFIGFVHNFAILFILISIMGIGVAIFHPEGGKMTNAVTPEKRKGKGMSIFSVGGNIGFALGPIIISTSTYFFGPEGILAIGIPSLIMAVLYARHNKKFVKYSERSIARTSHSVHYKDDYKGFALLTGMIYFRSSILFGLTTFTPLFFMKIFDQSPQYANLNLTVIATCAALASIFGGILSDKIGFKKVLFLSSLLSIPFMFLFCLSTNYILSSLLLVPVAFAIYGTLGVSMVMGQKFLCNHVGFASGVTVGLGVTFGGITSPLFGYIGDTYDLRATMWAIAIFTILTTIMAYLVPDIDKIRANLPKANSQNSEGLDNTKSLEPPENSESLEEQENKETLEVSNTQKAN
ncbi:MAG: MFS transporter [Succinivibrionaceae bacterium]|nr:MFS transporter [Succinivibrionaceae bacterium]MEE1339237.1 MFS transporter [Succinivibrionaceae bacterium]